MKKYKFFLITSAFQLIYCSLITKIKKKDSKNYFIVIFHHLNNEFTKNSIIYLAKKLKIFNIIDLRNEFKNYHLKTSKKINIFNKFKKGNINTEKVLKEKIISKIINKIPQNRNMEFYLRNNYGINEQIFIDIFSDKKFYGFLDGSGDYINFINLKILQLKISRYIKSFSLLLKSSRVNNGKILIWKKPIIFIKQKINDKENYKKIYKIFKKLKNKFEKKKISLIILGLPTLEYRKRFNLNLRKEANIYNDIINQLTKKFKLKNKYIWFKCHPRLNYDNYKFLKRNINCNFFSYSDFEIAELKMKNKSLKYVVSAGSSSLIYAQKVFKKKCIFLDLRNQNIEKDSFERNYLNFIKFNLETIKTKKEY